MFETFSKFNRDEPLDHYRTDMLAEKIKFILQKIPDHFPEKFNAEQKIKIVESFRKCDWRDCPNVLSQFFDDNKIILGESEKEKLEDLKIFHDCVYRLAQLETFYGVNPVELLSALDNIFKNYGREKSQKLVSQVIGLKFYLNERQREHFERPHTKQYPDPKELISIAFSVFKTLSEVSELNVEYVRKYMEASKIKVPPLWQPISDFLLTLNKTDPEKIPNCDILSDLAKSPVGHRYKYVAYALLERDEHLMEGTSILKVLNKFDKDHLEFIYSDEFKSKAMKHMIDNNNKFSNAVKLECLKNIDLNNLKILNQYSTDSFWRFSKKGYQLVSEQFKEIVNSTGIKMAFDSPWIYKVKEFIKGTFDTYDFVDASGCIKTAMIKIYNQEFDKSVNAEEIFKFVNGTLTDDYNHWLNIFKREKQRERHEKPWNETCTEKYHNKGIPRQDVFFLENLWKTIPSQQPKTFKERVNIIASILQGRVDEKLKEIKNRKVLSSNKNDEEIN
jgi:hypothetical protein